MSDNNNSDYDENSHDNINSEDASNTAMDVDENEDDTSNVGAELEEDNDDEEEEKEEVEDDDDDEGGDGGVEDQSDKADEEIGNDSDEEAEEDEDGDDDEEEEDDGNMEQDTGNGSDDGKEQDGDDDSDDDEQQKNVKEDIPPPTDQKKSSNKKRERYHVPKIFQDAVTVLIPLDVTADLKVALQKTRAKRIQSIYNRFPALQKFATKKNPKDDIIDSDDPMMGDDEEEHDKEKKKAVVTSKKKKLEHIPQPEQFGSVLDYLEAKYVKGVMIDDNDDDGQNLDDNSEGQGSVYSKDSFLDDTDLQRDVAEQVMASTTLTKVELEQEDGDFFVNVGNLELENDDYGENYDPLQDKENTKASKKKKRKSIASTATSGPPNTNSATPPAKKKKTTTTTTSTSKPEEPTSVKSKMSTSSVTSTKSKKSTGSVKNDNKDPSERSELQKAVKRTKARLDSQYKKGAAMVKKLTDEELPKRKTKLKVALTCPPNKKPGDDITFSNPHNPGQRLRVKVPKDCLPGSSFKVTVPVKAPPEEEGKDFNRFPREFQDFFDDYARAYDDWLEAKHALDPEFNVWKERQHKFDKFAKEFPSNLVTPVDSTYLKSALRRFRQNKAKRDKTKAASAAKLKDVKDVKEIKKSPGETKKKDNTEEETPPSSKTITIHIPGLGKEFPSKVWTEKDFS
ncbi:hypothetical protein IV203_015068 [Nitzschia inconspicua]|uniref:Uncharacterized protein n=1 Tax=Nitzschia inconspicua TaxID=303405 RepID=A0A9K3LB64_9STRA|nr:hypothetical protein IV203_015068 [Nitzschia inconspicua]